MNDSSGADQALCAEFDAAPHGRHSNDLRLLLQKFRGAEMGGKYCLIAVVPHRLWQLARMSGLRGVGPTPVDGETFYSLNDAEVSIFRNRLKEHRAREKREMTMVEQGQ